MQYTKLSNLKVIFLIPKRGKGHSEIVGNIFLISDKPLDPLDFIKFFIKYQRKVLTKDIIVEIGTTVIKELKLPNLYLKIDFTLPIDRLSPSLEDTLCFHLDCNYFCKCDCVVDFDNFEVSSGMKITCPVRVDFISTLEGNLDLEITQPKPNLYFEDLLDILQSYGKIVIYPVSKASDKKSLSKEIDSGKTIEDYLESVKAAIIHRKVAEAGKVNVSVADLYNNYRIEKGVNW